MSGTMKDSKMPAAWIAEGVARMPFQRLANGNISTCPVRIAFVDLLTPKEGNNDDGQKKLSYGCAVLVPPGGEVSMLSVLWPAWCEEARRAFPDRWLPNGQPSGLHWPVHDCADKAAKYSGYTPGCYYFNVSSQYKPQVCDAGMNIIVDPNRIYAGVWAILALNLYTYKNKKTGVSFGLQNVMIIGDDERLAGGGTDPKQDFAHVSITPHYDPAAAFGGMPANNVIPFPPAAGIMPAPQMVPAPMMPAPMPMAAPMMPAPAALPPPGTLDYNPMEC